MITIDKGLQNFEIKWFRTEFSKLFLQYTASFCSNFEEFGMIVRLIRSNAK